MPPAASSQFASNTVYDSLFSFEDGVNMGVSPLLLAKNQLAYGSNLTTRGSLIHPRPVRRMLTLNFGGNAALQTAVTKGLWQGKTYYKPDSGPEVLIASISGRLFQFLPSGTTAVVSEITGGNPQSSTVLQCWLWQAEKWVFWNDGINLPVFFDGTVTTRSRGTASTNPPNYTVATAFTGIGAGTSITLTHIFTGANGDSVTLNPGSSNQQIGVVSSGAGTTTIIVNFVNTIPTYSVPATTPLLDNTVATGTYTLAQTTVIPTGYVPGVDTSVLTLTTPYAGAIGDQFILSNGTTFAIQGRVTNIAANVVTAFLYPPSQFLQFVNGNSNAYVSSPISLLAGFILTPQTQAPQSATLAAQFPPGRMGAYGRGRVWMALTDGKQFIAGDIVGGPSGTKPLDFRDAVLNLTENDFLVGGGNFTVPGSVGDIRAMVFTAQLDAALGQGPLMIFTPTHVFSCNAPVDRLTWQSLTNPILTESAIGNGGLGQDSTFLVNSDTIYRAVDGIRSLILSTQDFNSWVRTPISHEVERVLSRDNQALLAFGQGVFFDNRVLMSASPISTPQGVYHQALIALNTDLITTVREKKPPAYDGPWPGMNIMGLVAGEFSQVQRCYEFVYNTVLKSLELWELMPSSASDVENQSLVPIVGDNGTDAIEWWFESPVIFREQNPANRTFKQLVNGEIMVDKLVGRVDFEAFYKPDQYPCWIPWLSWSECAVQNTGQSSGNTKPAFAPRMGLGSPSSTPCDPFTNRPLNQGYSFQIKLVITGQCEFVGARLAATVLPEPFFAKLKCC